MRLLHSLTGLFGLAEHRRTTHSVSFHFCMVTMNTQQLPVNDSVVMQWQGCFYGLGFLCTRCWFLYVSIFLQVIREWGKGNSYTLEAAFITGSCISIAIKSVLFWALIHVYRSFGQGLRERSKYFKKLFKKYFKRLTTGSQLSRELDKAGK